MCAHASVWKKFTPSAVPHKGKDICGWPRKVGLWQALHAEWNVNMPLCIYCTRTLSVVFEATGFASDASCSQQKEKCH